MNNFLKILILPVVIITMLGIFAPKAFAIATPLNVQFVPNPLFDKPNFLPEDETTGTVTVANNSGTTQNLATEAIHVSDGDHFGNILNLKIVGSSGTLFDDSLANFFTTAGEFPLGTIANGQSKTFTYTISFTNSNDNSYQGKTLGFDVCVGFLGGQTHCGGTVVDGGGDNGGTDGGGSSSRSSTGGSSGSIVDLIIFNEQAIDITNIGGIGRATIIWNTNLSSTSQIVYGLAPGPYTLIITPPYFGYPINTALDGTMVTNHSMFLTNLIPGQTYLYRVTSHTSSSLPTVSAEHQFTVPLFEGNNNLFLNNAQANQNTATGLGNVLGASTGPITDDRNGSETSSGNVLSSNNLTAAVFGSGFGDILSTCSLISLLVLLLIYIIWRLWLRRKYEKSGILEEEIRNRFYIFFGGSSLLAIIICVIFGLYCPLPIFILAFIISACVYVFRKLTNKYKSTFL